MLTQLFFLQLTDFLEILPLLLNTKPPQCQRSAKILVSGLLKETDFFCLEDFPALLHALIKTPQQTLERFVLLSLNLGHMSYLSFLIYIS